MDESKTNLGYTLRCWDPDKKQKSRALPASPMCSSQGNADFVQAFGLRAHRTPPFMDADGHWPLAWAWSWIPNWARPRSAPGPGRLGLGVRDGDGWWQWGRGGKTFSHVARLYYAPALCTSSCTRTGGSKTDTPPVPLTQLDGGAGAEGVITTCFSRVWAGPGQVRQDHES